MNADYAAIPSYPAVLLVPQEFPDHELGKVIHLRQLGRIPVCTWKHPKCDAILARSVTQGASHTTRLHFYRCSQHTIGLVRSRGTHTDESYFAALLRANPASATLQLFDARPKAHLATLSERIRTSESDEGRDAEYTFLDIENLHVMRKSQKQLCRQCRPYLKPSDSAGWGPAVSDWLGHLHSILRGAVRIVRAIHQMGSSVVLHCRYLHSRYGFCDSVLLCPAQ